MIKGRNVAAALHLRDHRQLMLQRPGPSAARHRPQNLGTSHRLQTYSRPGVQSARNDAMIHGSKRLNQSAVNARWGPDTAYGGNRHDCVEKLGLAMALKY